MFNRHMRNSIIVIFLLLLLSNTAFAGDAIVDINNLDKGIVSISYEKNIDNMKVLISKDGKSENYDLVKGGVYPLQLGDGEYNVSLLKHVSGNKYQIAEQEKVNLKIKDKNSLFLQSTFMVDWNKDMKAVKKAKDLSKNAKNDKEKVDAVYNYLVNNIKYDHEKAAKVQSGYFPELDLVLESQLGICYDYAVLSAGMLRSLGIPTKLVMGYNVDIEEYHAWNEVFIDGQWKIIDTTYDAAYFEAGRTINMIKSAEDYTVEKVY